MVNVWEKDKKTTREKNRESKCVIERERERKTNRKGKSWLWKCVIEKAGSDVKAEQFKMKGKSPPNCRKFIDDFIALKRIQFLSQSFKAELPQLQPIYACVSALLQSVSRI